MKINPIETDGGLPANVKVISLRLLIAGKKASVLENKA
jgi:hypothetical protein